VVSELALLPNDRTLRRWNFTAAVYMLASLAVDAAVGWHIWSLAELHRSLLEAADALTLTARAVGLVGEVPVVGNGAYQLAGSITDTAVQLRTNALTVRTQVHALAVVVAVAIALLPTVPLVALYLPLRVARAREVAGLKRKLAGSVDPMLVEHLAHAARNRGVRRFTASMAADNGPAHRLMARLTSQLEQRHAGGGVDELVLDIAA
jgi:hypothetical protein